MKQEKRIFYIFMVLSAVVIVIGAILLLPKDQRDDNKQADNKQTALLSPTPTKKTKEQQLADDIKALGSTDVEARKRVISEGPGVLPVLLKTLSSGDHKTKDGVYLVVNQMVRNDAEGAFKNFDQIIRNGSPAEIMDAIKLISIVGNPKVAQALYWAVNSQDANIRNAAIKALQSSALVDPSLFGMLKDAYDKYGREDKYNEIIRSIGNVAKNNQEAAQFVMQIAQGTKDIEEKLACVSALGRIGSPVVGNALLGLSFKDAPDQDICRLAQIQAFANMKFKGAIQPLFEILKSDSTNLYHDASLALSQISEEKDFPVLPLGATRAEAQKVANEWEARLTTQK